jgi:hypothetical protein
MGNIYALHFLRLRFLIALSASSDSRHTPMPAAAPWQKILNAGITFRLCKISRHASIA